MCLFRRFALILILCVAVCSTEVSAQDLIGTSGLINIPTADMQPDGTFDGGARWMSPAALHDLVNYDTGLYYVRFTPFSLNSPSERRCLRPNTPSKKRGITTSKTVLRRFVFVHWQNAKGSGGLQSLLG